MAKLIPLSLRDAPSLIESVFPAQKISIEAQRERKAGSGQTLTALGSYWKGRKPLILVRAIVLGSLLPRSDNAESDLEIFEKLMAFDNESLARRALIQNKLKPKDIAARITIKNPWDYFAYSIKKGASTTDDVTGTCFPFDADAANVTIRWRRDVSVDDKLAIFRIVIDTYSSYDEKASLAKRPEEIDQDWLYESVWPAVNFHYSKFGISVFSHEELIDQLGILRFGRRPRVGDTFAGGGSIPFEAARLGCDVYASDLNPIACMLTWGSLNVVGAPPDRREEIERAQREVAEVVDKEVTGLGIEHDEHGNRAKVFLYCLETKCPETGWLVPMSPSWVISKSRKVAAELIPDYENRRFDINVVTGATPEEMKTADTGTIQGGSLVYELNEKLHRTPIKTLRGDYRDPQGTTRNRLRRWERNDFRPAPEDVFQERLYAIQWTTAETKDSARKETFFASVTPTDLHREKLVIELVKHNLSRWQADGLVPDMEIEPGDKTDEPIRTRGWTHWHHLFNARQLHLFSLYKKYVRASSEVTSLYLVLSKALDWSNRLTKWDSSLGSDKVTNLFFNQALNTNFNYGCRGTKYLENHTAEPVKDRNYASLVKAENIVRSLTAQDVAVEQDIWITDPPYADAVHYHEITEFFISWLRKNPPPPFDEWNWDSRRALAIKGVGNDFRHGMVQAYGAMTEHMPDNGMQCVMFTHQDTGVWSDMIGIFWAAGLQVVAAWYIATETTSELKKGGYVQGTVILMLRKRLAAENSGFKQRILPAVRNEVKRQIEQMMNLNDEVEQKLGEPVFNDSDLQMAGYAAALKVLTAYTHIGGEDVTSFALRPRQRGEVTVVDEIVQQAAEAANSLLVPEGLSGDTWQRISGIQRFYLRMVDMETTGASKLDNYQNFAKAFRVDDYTKVMGNMTANKARLKRISEFKSRDLTGGTEIGATWLGRLIIGLQQLIADTDPQVVISQLQMELPDFMEVRPLLIDMLQFLQAKASEEEIRSVAEVLANRLRNLRALGQ